MYTADCEVLAVVVGSYREEPSVIQRGPDHAVYTVVGRRVIAKSDFRCANSFAYITIFVPIVDVHRMKFLACAEINYEFSNSC